MESTGQNYRRLRYWCELPVEVAQQSIKAIGNAALGLVGLEVVNRPRAAQDEVAQEGAI